MLWNKTISRIKPNIIVVLIVNAPLIPFVTNIIVVIDQYNFIEKVLIENDNTILL